MVSMPASKAYAYAQELSTKFEGPPQEFRLRQIIKECNLLIDRVGTHELGSFHHIAGTACYLLELYADALTHLNMVCALGHAAPLDHNNVALVLVQLGRPRDALDRLMKISDIRVEVLTVYVDALVRLGEIDDARAAFEDAADMAKSAVEHFAVAVAASDLKLHVEACEMFARAISIELKKPLAANERSIDFIRNSPDKVKGCLRYNGASNLRRSIEKMENNGDQFLLWHNALECLPKGAEPSQDDESSLEIFESMKPHRTRANAAMGTQGNGTV